ncbi:MAG: hypothetical protein II881_02755 [Oscillospiraceae bacterium]|nr:hypothetical protein [Oscillospiraceae bacterium]
MQEVSQKFNDLWSTPGKLTDVKFTINDVEYLNDAIYPSALSRRMFANDEPAVGSVVQSTFSSSVVLKSDIPKHATVKVYNRVVHPDNGEASEWIRRGEFYINSRRGYTAGSVLEFAAKDAIGKTNKSYKDYTGFTSWPQNENAVVAEIAQIIGVTVDVRTVLAGYSVPYPNDYTMREILGYIAAANGGNWTITDVSTLRLVKLTGNADDLNIGNRAASFVSLGDTGAYTGVTIWWDDDNAFSAGNDSGTVLECDCPWATQTMADNLLLQVSGLSLRAYTASLTDVSPAAELGDVVIIEGVRCVLNDYDVSLDGTHQPSISSPALSEADEDYEPELQRQMRRAVKLGQSYYGTKITRENGLVIEKTDGTDTEASVTLNADELAFRSNENGVMRDKLYFDPVTGQYVFDGKITVRDGSIEFIGGASFTQVRYSTDPQATVPGGWSDAWDPEWDDGSTRVFAIYSYNGGTDWTDPVMIQGADGDAGESPITVSLFSTAGTVISQGVTSTRIYAVVMQGGVDITLNISYLRFSWHKYFKDGTEDLNWHPTYTYEGRRDSINVSESDIASTATFTCLIEEES